MFSRLHSIPPRRAFSAALALWGMTAGFVLFTKGHKIARLGGPWDLDAGLAFAQDGALLAGLALVLLWAFSRRNASGIARGVVIAAHVVLPLYIAAAIFEHAFFVTTGSLLDGTYVAMRMASLAQDFDVIGSEVTGFRALVLLLPFVVSAAAWRLNPRSPPPASGGPGMKWWRISAATASAAFVVFGSLSFVPLGERLAQLHPNFLVGFVRSAVQRDTKTVLSSTNRRALPEGPSRIVAAGTAKAKNALLVVLESTGASRTSVYTPSLATTPALSALARRGAVVERAYTSIPHTTKALVSLNCGIYPKMSPGTEEAIYGAIPTECLADLLRAQGFATAYFQSAEENYERRKDLVTEFGFETFKGKESLDGTGFDEASYFGWEDDVLVKPVLEWIDTQRADDKRFFGALLTLTAHHPYAIPRGFQLTPYADDRAKNDYLNAVRYVDRTVEKLVAGLDARGVLDDTLLIVVGDHGEGFGEHRRYQHDAVIYEEGIHIPMVLAGAGVSAGQRIDGLRQNVDVAPTILDALGFRPQGGQFDGKSVLSTPGHEELFVSCHYQNYCMAHITPSLKTIYHFNKGAPELFDVVKDPQEKRNLLGVDPTRRDEVDATAKRMLDLKSSNNRRYDQRTKSRVKRFVTKSAPDPQSIPNYRALDILVDDHTRLVGAAVTPEIEAGDQVEITTFYEVLKAPGGGWRTFHTIFGPKALHGDHTPVEGAYPVRRWKAGDFIEDRYVVSTRPDTLVGAYHIFTGLTRGKKGPPGVARKDGVVVAKDGRVRLSDFVITKPKVDRDAYIFASPPAILDDPASVKIDARFGDLVKVHAVSIDKAAIKGGLKTTLTYVFEVLAPLGDAAFSVDFSGPSKVERLAHVPVSGMYPPSAWTPGQFIVDHHEIITHTRHQNGKYRVFLRLDRDGVNIPATSADRDVEDGALHVGTYTLRD